MENKEGKIIAVCISEKRGTEKKNIHECEVVEGFGLKNDAHGGNWHRQVSLLSYEKIEDFKRRGGDVIDGDFAGSGCGSGGASGSCDDRAGIVGVPHGAGACDRAADAGGGDAGGSHSDLHG